MSFCNDCESKPFKQRMMFGGSLWTPCPMQKRCAGNGQKANTAIKVCHDCSDKYGICLECGGSVKQSLFSRMILAVMKKW